MYNNTFKSVGKQLSMYSFDMPVFPFHLSKLIGNKWGFVAKIPQYPASKTCASPYGAPCSSN